MNGILNRKTESVQHVLNPQFVEIYIYKMQHLGGGSMPFLYMGRKDHRV
jgi:hypothetical protein